MKSDILSGLTQTIEKTSNLLGRTANYTQKSRISRLPRYLVVIRFQWKVGDNVKAKILKVCHPLWSLTNVFFQRVKFPFELDMCDCCTPELIAKLKPARDHLKLLDDAREEEVKKRMIDEKKGIFVDKEDDTAKMVESHSVHVSKYKELGIETELASDIGANVSGWYDLVAVLTHFGRTEESRHYIGWVKIRQQW
jgi:ubiquitin carboxyl-terminal hydrolase 14